MNQEPLKIKLGLCLRTCKCGCGQTWFATEGSTNEYASQGHEPWLDMSFKAQAARRKARKRIGKFGVPIG